ncbi:hypothetical protein [Dactylosporangium sp. CA-092794]|uniref:hypothetical protein n=1 Tax=Dactylosporangium sp. CA-092794 TaxID=3239929 RepID=UPI003D8D5805
MTETVAQLATEPQIDQELLAEARDQLNGVTSNEALNEGLRMLVRHKRQERREALRERRRMSREGACNYAALDGASE